MTIGTEKLRALLADAAEMGLKLPVESIGIAVRDIERRELCCLYDEPWGALIAAAVNALPELLDAADALATAEAERLTLARALLRCTSADELSCPLTEARSIARAVLVGAGEMVEVGQ